MWHGLHRIAHVAAVAVVIISASGCATMPKEPPIAPVDESGSLPLPESDGQPRCLDRQASDTLARTLEPGDRVVAINRPADDIATAEVQNGPKRWTVTLKKRDGCWDIAETPTSR
jgi:hypothetical protein